MSRNWTPQQKNAIEARNGSVLVSAAAGSGKTAVLVQRVIERITDPKNPTDADRLLIVTFTKLAAQEMRERIAAAISELIKKDPTDLRLIKQQMLLADAKICTIDSFCSSVVKENFELLDISSDFRTADSGELAVIKKEALALTVEKMYESGSADFRRLIEMLFSGSDDSEIESAIDRLYEVSRSFAFPEKWLSELSDDYSTDIDVKESIHGKIVLERVRQGIEYSLSVFRRLLEDTAGDEVLEKIYNTAVSTDIAQCEYILSRIEEGSWDDVRSALLRFKAATKGRAPKEMKEDPQIVYFAALRDHGKDNITKKIKELVCCSEKDYKDDIRYFSGAVKSLTEATLLYSDIYSQMKKSRKVADFSDIMHMTLSLFVRSTESGYERTELAARISECYDEILIDEYQDTNGAQSLLFESISRNNLFRVGDVKQSIYSFRQAMPEIFMSLKDKLETYDPERDNYPSKIILANNFRSRKGVTDIINFIFEQIMSRESGDIEYGSEERLTASAAYEEKTEAATEVHLLDTGNADENEETAHEYQARYIASQIKRLMAEGYTVKDGSVERPVSYRDFAVLMRGISTNGTVYAETFRKEGIPCFIEVSDNFLASNEIALVLNILRIIDNPAQDIPLLSVMMSPVFGFSTDKVAEIKKFNRKASVYSCLLESERRGDAECTAFLEKLREWRSMSICLGVGELLNEIYEQTALPCIFDAVDKSGTGSANLRLMLDYSSVYEKSGYMGLSGFIRFIDRLSSQKQDLTGALNACSNADVVRIMTIHKSKGLEFPVCILANCNGKFNIKDEAQSLILSKKAGVAIRHRDIATYEQFESLPRTAVKLAMHRDMLSEELRVLYVALTRAKEKLMLVYAGKNIASSVAKCGVDLVRESRSVMPYAISQASGFGQWMLTALLRHKDSEALREIANLDDSFVLPCESPIRVFISEGDPLSVPSAEESEKGGIDEGFLSMLRERGSFRYKYEALSGINMKRTASSVDKGSIDREYFASSKPAFLCEGGLTGAQKGTATHRFAQYADYERAKADLEGEIQSLLTKGLISEAEAKAINRRNVGEFLKSGLLSRILASERVLREKRFIIEVPINEIYENVDEFSDEKVMIQGACDCAFVEDGKLVVIDYKTDLIDSEEEFIEKYSSQVLLYKKALELCTGLEVKETLLYSFHLSREIGIKEKN